MNGILNKWLTGLLGLGAGVLVLSNPNGFGAFANGFKNLTGGTVNTIVRGK